MSPAGDVKLKIYKVKSIYLRYIHFSYRTIFNLYTSMILQENGN